MSKARKEQAGEPLNLRIPADLKRSFKLWCVAHDKDMTEVLVAYIAKLVAPKDSKPK